MESEQGKLFEDRSLYYYWTGDHHTIDEAYQRIVIDILRSICLIHYTQIWQWQRVCYD